MGVASVRFSFDPSKLKEKVKREFDRRVEQVANEVADQVRENISTPVATHGRSLPYEYPHLETGELRDKVVVQVVGRGRAKVGDMAEHAGWLEEGTEYMEPRPFLRRTLLEMRRRVQQVFLAPVRGLDVMNVGRVRT